MAQFNGKKNPTTETVSDLGSEISCVQMFGWNNFISSV